MKLLNLIPFFGLLTIFLSCSESNKNGSQTVKMNNGDYSYTTKEHFDTRQADSLVQIANIRSKNENKPEALVLLYQALEFEPNNKTIYNNIGSIYLQLRKLDSAEYYLEQAISIDSEYYRGMMNVSLLYLRQKRFDEAININTTIIANSPDLMTVSTAHYNNGIAYGYLENLDQSLKSLELAGQINDENDFENEHVLLVIEKVENRKKTMHNRM